MAARHREAVRGVRVDHRAEALPRVADGGDAVGMRAGTRDEAVVLGDAAQLVRRDGEGAALRELGLEEPPRARRVAAEQVEHEALEVRCLRDVHRRARRLVRLGGAAHAVGAGAEELVEHVVLVGREHQALDRQAHHARDVAGADVAEVAGRHGEAHARQLRSS